MKERRVLFYCLLMCVATGVLVYWLIANQQKKVAVIDAIKLFDEFNMKKELEEIAKKQLQTESRQLDSITNQLQIARRLNNNNDSLKLLAYECNRIKAKLDNDYAQSNSEINTQVWKRLNPLLDEYGKKKNLHLIIGANGMGSVLYTDSYFDLTNDAIPYINKRYAEGN